MSEYNNCYFEGTLWQPALKTNANTGKSTWSAKLSVYKTQNEDTPVMLRAYGSVAEELNRNFKERVQKAYKDRRTER